MFSTSVCTGELLDITIAICEPAGVTVLIKILETGPHILIYSSDFPWLWQGSEQKSLLQFCRAVKGFVLPLQSQLMQENT